MDCESNGYRHLMLFLFGAIRSLVQTRVEEVPCPIEGMEINACCIKNNRKAALSFCGIADFVSRIFQVRTCCRM